MNDQNDFTDPVAAMGTELQSGFLSTHIYHRALLAADLNALVEQMSRVKESMSRMKHK